MVSELNISAQRKVQHQTDTDSSVSVAFMKSQRNQSILAETVYIMQHVEKAQELCLAMEGKLNLKGRPTNGNK